MEILLDWALCVICQSGRSLASAHRVLLEIAMAMAGNALGNWGQTQRQVIWAHRMRPHACMQDVCCVTHITVWLVDLLVVGTVARGRTREIFGTEMDLLKRAMRGRAEREWKGSHVLSLSEVSAA